MLSAIRHIVLGIIDFFYKPFERFISKQTFRYLACGGSNTVLDTILYYVAFHYILKEQGLPVGAIVIKPYIAAFMMSFSVSFPLGFILSKYIVFPESNLHGRVQLFRYAVLVGSCIILNYLFLRVFIELCHIYPTPSKLLTTAVVAIFSYFSQRKYTFKIKNTEPEVVPENIP